MQNYEKYEKELVSRLQRELGFSYNVYMQNICLNNNIRRKCLFIIEKGGELAECFTIEQYYELCNKQEDIDLIAMDIIRDYKRRKAYNDDFCADKFYNWDFVKSNIMFRIINYRANRELLQNIPHIEICDLSLVFYLLADTDVKYSKSVLINNSMLRIWGAGAKEICKNARKNTPIKLPAQFKNINGSVSEDILNVMNEYREEELPMYILTNSMAVYGASCVLYDGMLETISQKFGSGFYVLPSSLHEVILVPAYVCDKLFAKRLKRLVMTVNFEMLPQQDVLSDSIYYYSKNEKHLFIAADSD